jgi:group I intron endonuclease
MYIYRALLKHGYSNFSLTILEYCSPEKCLEREDYYFQLLKHEYNICFATKSRLQTWLKHSEKTLEKMKGENHPNFGQTRSEETRKTKISHALKGKPRPSGAGMPSQQIEVTDMPSFALEQAQK